MDLKNLIYNFKRFKILIVDDQASARRSIRSILSTLGFTNFREAEDGDSALRKIRAEVFNFIFLKWRLPLVDGGAVARTVHGEGLSAKSPIVMLVSGNVEARAAENARDYSDGAMLLPLLPHVVEDEMTRILFAKLQPTEFDQKLQAAGAAMAQNRFDLAMKLIDRAETLDSRSPMIGYFRNLVYEAQNDSEKAREAVLMARQSFQIVVQGPRLAQEQMDKGRAFLGEGRLDEARAAFEQAMDLNPDDDLKAHIGDAYLDVGHAEEAERIFKDSIESNPGDVHLYNRLGIAFRRQRKFEEAIINYQKALEIDPREENLHYNLARARLSAGDRPGALESLRHALEIEPDFKEAASLLKKVKAAQQRKQA